MVCFREDSTSLQLTDVVSLYLTAAYLRMLIFISLRDWEILIFYSSRIYTRKHTSLLQLIFFKLFLGQIWFDSSGSPRLKWSICCYYKPKASGTTDLIALVVILFLFFHRLTTLQRLLRRPKTFPRRTRRGSEWWSSPRARMIPWQPSVGQSSSEVPLQPFPTLAPFGNV